VGKLRLNTDLDARVYHELELKVGRTDEASDETYLGLAEDDFRADPYRRYAASQLDFLDAEHRLAQLRHVVRPSSALDVTTVLYRTDFARSWYKLNDVDGEGLGDVLADPGAFPEEFAVLRGATSAPGVLRVRDNAREYYAQGVQTVVGLALGAGGVRHELELGGRWHRDEEDRFQRDDRYSMVEGRMVLASRGAPGSQSNRVSEAEAWSFFLQDRIALGRWTLTPGVRLEDVSFTRSDWAADDPGRDRRAEIRENGVTALIPGVGATWDPTSDLTLLAGVHRGFGPPGPGADEETDAEQSVNYELGARLRRGPLQAQAVGFLNDYGNVLGAATLSSGGDGSGDLFNGGEVDVHGLELSLDWQAEPGFARALGAVVPVRLAYTYTRAEFGSSFESEFEPWGSVRTGDELPYVPDHQLHAGVGLEGPSWAVRVASTYVDEMRTEAGSGPIPEGSGTDDHLILGLTGELAVTPWSRVFASVQNLTDEAYVAARRPEGARPGLPRTLAAGLRLTP
jgi:Fe(3+) dicitrate transport protein